MYNIKICRAQREDAPYIEEKLKKYLLSAGEAGWEQFFVAKYNNKTVAFGRIVDHGDFLEIASVGVDYYHRGKGIGVKMLRFLVEEAKRHNPKKAIYVITHRPGFAAKAGFKEVSAGPEVLEYKRDHECILDASKNKIMKVVSKR